MEGGIGINKLYLESMTEDAYITYLEEKWRPCHFIYADGDLEALAGYDIVGYNVDDGFDFTTDRIEQVIAVLYNGTEVPATLFLWHCEPHDAMSASMMEKDPVYRLHGRVVANTDTEGIQIAERKYYTKDSIN